jgi:hypothetical protein
LRLLLVLLLLLVVSLLLAGVPAVRASLVWCLVRRVVGHDRLATGQVDVDTAGIVLGGIIQAEFLADLFDARLDLLDMAGRVVAFTDDAGGVLVLVVFFSLCPAGLSRRQTCLRK